MSLNAEALVTRNRRACDCGRPALYWSRARRRFRWMPDHPLCRPCWRSLDTRARVEAMVAARHS